MEARKVEPAHGRLWIKQGWEIFKKAPVLWVVLSALFATGPTLISNIPVIGEPLATLLVPVLLGGLMLGCQALERGEHLMLGHLFAGFHQRAQQLIALGGIGMVWAVLTELLMRLVGGTALVETMSSTQPEQDPTAMLNAITDASGAWVLGGVMICAYLMASMFAPMLVLFDGMGPIDALKTSFKACMKNIGPLFVYGLVIVLLALLTIMTMGLGLVILLPLSQTSAYAAYRDIFKAQGGNPTT